MYVRCLGLLLTGFALCCACLVGLADCALMGGLGGCVEVSGFGPARGRLSRCTGVAASTHWLAHSLCGNRESSRRQTPPHSRPETQSALYRWHACASSQGDGAGFWRQPHSRLPQRVRANRGVDAAARAFSGPRPRGGAEPKPRPIPLARGLSQKPHVNPAAGRIQTMQRSASSPGTSNCST